MNFILTHPCTPPERGILASACREPKKSPPWRGAERSEAGWVNLPLCRHYGKDLGHSGKITIQDSETESRRNGESVNRGSFSPTPRLIDSPTHKSPTHRLVAWMIIFPEWP